ncbi:MAG: divalent metal cation transporter [Chryseolinea sp.]
MEKSQSWKSVVIWSIISAAFIGPGTVTTAVSAGSQFQLNLLWAVTFATVACVVLQEVAARITIASGRNLGQVLMMRYGQSGKYLQILVGGSVIAGCAAYEAGNILGAVVGVNLLTGLKTELLTIIIVAISFILLWKGNPAWISNLMLLLVMIMGIAFAAVAFSQHFSLSEIVLSAVVPSIPPKSELLLLGLLGTTVVPYNIFLGSGISKGQTIKMMRLGLIISVMIGGMITSAILIAGNAVSDFSSFENLYIGLQTKVGTTAAIAVALGLAAAGLSSAITSPYAAAIIARNVFEVSNETRVKLVWIGVLATGFIFGISGVKPIPVILFVQALNGLILPLLVIFLIIVINDPAVIPEDARHSNAYNIILLMMLCGIVLISFNNIDKSVTSTFGLAGGHFLIVLMGSLVVSIVVGILIFRGNRRE